jgi:hypothetical protein
MDYNITISEKNYNKIFNHLFPGDGLEAVAIALCGYHETDTYCKFTIYKSYLIPYSDCIRSTDKIIWKTEILRDLLLQANKYGFSILKIHSHPGGYSQFSHIDDDSDRELFSSIYGWMDHTRPHLSCVALPDGSIFGRVITRNLDFNAISKVVYAGKTIKFWSRCHDQLPSSFTQRTQQAFGEKTVSILRNLKIAVIGCSGTGSPTIEQLVRLGVGSIVLIDPDCIEVKNLNRILNTTLKDANEKKFKTDVLKERIESFGLGTRVTSIPENFIGNPKVVDEIISCDVVFGCMDSIDGRHYLNQLCNFYLIPYFDLGVKIKSNGNGGIEYILSSIHYISPGSSSLLARNLYTNQELKSTNLKRINYVEYLEQRSQKYLVDVEVDSPAVISVNMLISSLAICDFLDRIHSFRQGEKESYDITRVSLHDWYIQNLKENNDDPYSEKWEGRGDMIPFINMQE